MLQFSFPKFTIEAALVCDDIRIENNGKTILIGIYNDGIFTSTIPSQLPLCLWMRFRPKAIGQLTFSVRCRLADQVAFKADLEIDVTKIEATHLPTPRLPLNIVREGPAIFELGEGKEWHPIASLDVVLATPEKMTEAGLDPRAFNHLPTIIEVPNLAP